MFNLHVGAYHFDHGYYSLKHFNIAKEIALANGANPIKWWTIYS